MEMSFEAPLPSKPKIETVPKAEKTELDEKKAFELFSQGIISESERIKKTGEEKSKIANISPDKLTDINARIDATVIESHVEAMFAGKEKPEWAKDPKVEIQMRELIGKIIKKSDPAYLKEALDSASSLVSQFYDSHEASLIDPRAIGTLNKVVDILPSDKINSLLQRFSYYAGEDENPEATKEISAKSVVPDFIKRRMMAKTLGYVDYAVEKAHDPETARHVLEGIIDVLENENVNKLKLALSFSEVNIDNIITSVKYIKENTKDDTELAYNVWNLWHHILSETEPSLDWFDSKNKLPEKIVELGKQTEQKFRDFYPYNSRERRSWPNTATPEFKPSDLDKMIRKVKVARNREEIDDIFKKLLYRK